MRKREMPGPAKFPPIREARESRDFSPKHKHLSTRRHEIITNEAASSSHTVLPTHRPCQESRNTLLYVRFGDSGPSGIFTFTFDFDFDNTGLCDPRVPTSSSTAYNPPNSIRRRSIIYPGKAETETMGKLVPFAGREWDIGRRSPWILRSEISGQNNQVSRAPAFRPASRSTRDGVLWPPTLQCG